MERPNRQTGARPSSGGLKSIEERLNKLERDLESIRADMRSGTQIDGELVRKLETRIRRLRQMTQDTSRNQDHGSGQVSL